jgi:ATP-dependent 26S proteasome regulatory subunit
MSNETGKNPVRDKDVVETEPRGPKIALDTRSELEVLIRARYPLIYVVSWEEDRALHEIDRIAQILDKKVYTWDINNGIARYRRSIEGKIEGKKGTKDPILAIREIAEITDPSIFVLKDYHAYVKDSTVIRGLRNLATTLRQTYVSVVILSPILEIPPELEKDITIVDFPLPAKKDLEVLLHQICDDLKGNPNFHVDVSDESKDKILEAAVGLTLNEAENVFAKTLVITGRLTAKEVPFIYSEKKQIIRKTGLLEYIEVDEHLSGVGGLQALKDWLIKRRLAFSDKARAFGLPTPKGVLFLGIQGCGKSLCAKAVANFWEVPLLRLDMGKLFGSFVGTSEHNVRRAISIAESVSPVILWIDEIDKGFSGLQSSAFSDSGTTARVFGTLITWLQEKTVPVFVIATANNVEVLPPELMRKGRFDEIFFVDLPNIIERKEIFFIHVKKRKRDPRRFDLEVLAKETEGFSGSEIEQVVISGLYDAYVQGKDVDTEILRKAIAETYPLSKTIREEIEYRRTWAKGRARMAS